ncbi:hypothetical protein [Niveispirillum sp.]|uniref:hypothetical protein n=1 Tax=Niveispirillum sp. TaxID=1917217 RepID=UPI001B7C4588|nr:hypothetical protein [Niveispirillum sp.]MBP7338682.1 hypothetical protein [Niveispirillum sp.]
MTRPAFMSPAWLALAQAALQTALDRHPERDRLHLSLIERFDNLPADAPRPVEGEPCLRLDVADGRAQVRYGTQPGERTETEITCAWMDAWRSASLHAGPDLTDLRAEQIATGRLRMTGDLAAWAPLLGPVHEHMADHTPPP